jgi:hypothetical protein
VRNQTGVLLAGELCAERGLPVEDGAASPGPVHQTRCREHLEMLGHRARVSAVDWVLSLALAPVGTIAGGAAAALAGIRVTLAIAGATAAATGSVLLLPG